MEKIEKKKIYYPNGKLKAELSLKKGIPHGLYRDWFEDGVLASELNFKNGIPDGISRYWDENGNLLIENNIINGTGVQKSWEPVTRLWAEQSWIDGMCTGRCRVSEEDGTVVKDEYWIKNRQVSRKKYIQMCELDETLPRYDDLVKDKKTTRKPKKEAFSGGSYFDYEAYYNKLFSEHQMVDALQWLIEPDVPERTLGECTRPEDSVELVKDFYILGAVKVWTFDIDGAPDEEQNSGKLVIQLPEDSRKRKKILEKCNGIATVKGFDAESDYGQKYTFVMLD
jgi:hypothetical protein